MELKNGNIQFPRKEKKTLVSLLYFTFLCVVVQSVLPNNISLSVRYFFPGKKVTRIGNKIG